MELKDYLRVLNKQKGMVIFLTILITLFAFIFAYFQPTVYDTSIAFTVNRTAKQQTADYQYDGYYAIQASNLFAQTIMSWLMTPSVLLEIYNQAGVDPNIGYLDKFASRFQTKKLSSQSVAVRFKERDEATADKIARSIINVMETKAVDLNQTSEGDSLFKVVGSNPVIVPYKPDVLTVSLIGLAVGFLFSCFLSYVIYYFKKE
ncbi:MAG: Wzz/FepE/Etk N-terminal domain-containing protein [bacterium]